MRWYMSSTSRALIGWRPAATPPPQTGLSVGHMSRALVNTADGIRRQLRRCVPSSLIRRSGTSAYHVRSRQTCEAGVEAW